MTLDLFYQLLFYIIFLVLLILAAQDIQNTQKQLNSQRWRKADSQMYETLPSDDQSKTFTIKEATDQIFDTDDLIQNGIDQLLSEYPYLRNSMTSSFMQEEIFCHSLAFQNLYNFGKGPKGEQWFESPTKPKWIRLSLKQKNSLQAEFETHLESFIVGGIY